MYTLGAGRIFIKKFFIIVCLLNLMAWSGRLAGLTEQVKMKRKKDNDKIKNKPVQTSSACGRIGPNFELA